MKRILIFVLSVLAAGAAACPLAARSRDADVVKSVGDAGLLSRAEDYRALIPKFLDFSY